MKINNLDEVIGVGAFPWMSEPLLYVVFIRDQRHEIAG